VGRRSSRPEQPTSLDSVDRYWLDFSGVELDPTDSKQVAATAAVELEASGRDPYRQLSHVFHPVGRTGGRPA